MAIRAGAEGAFEEVFLSEPGISLCLLVSRRARVMRVIDFRSGASPQKRAAVAAFARRAGIERMYTVVERDECTSWMRMGFAREGNIPFFYKRSDAHVLGTLVSQDGYEDADPEHSGTRLALGADGTDPSIDRLYQACRKLMKDREELPQLAVKVQPAKDTDVAKAVSVAARAGRALTGFEPFGRSGSRASWLCTARGGLSLYASAEVQQCFDHAFFELLTSPRTDKERERSSREERSDEEGAEGRSPRSTKEWGLARAAVHHICEELSAKKVVGCFALSPVEDLELGSMYLCNGFRKTAVLRRHALVGNRRADVFLWSRKLANPTDS